MKLKQKKRVELSHIGSNSSANHSRKQFLSPRKQFKRSMTTEIEMFEGLNSNFESENDHETPVGSSAHATNARKELDALDPLDPLDAAPAEAARPTRPVTAPSEPKGEGDIDFQDGDDELQHIATNVTLKNDNDQKGSRHAVTDGGDDDKVSDAANDDDIKGFIE